MTTFTSWLALCKILSYHWVRSCYQLQYSPKLARLLLHITDNRHYYRCGTSSAAGDWRSVPFRSVRLFVANCWRRFTRAASRSVGAFELVGTEQVASGFIHKISATGSSRTNYRSCNKQHARVVSIYFWRASTISTVASTGGQCSADITHTRCVPAVFVGRVSMSSFLLDKNNSWLTRTCPLSLTFLHKYIYVWTSAFARPELNVKCVGDNKFTFLPLRVFHKLK